MTVQPSLETVTPQQAQDWLEKNLHNRSLKRAVVDRLAEAILRGEWVLNGESIKFDQDENLIDGQHRLAAIVQAGGAVQTLVVRGLSAAAQETVDIGTKRSVADILKLRGETNTTQLGAGLSWLWRYERRQMRTGPPDPTPQELLRLLEANPTIRESVSPAARLGNAVKYPSGLGTCVHYLLSQEDEEEANWFFQRLQSGANLHERDPILALRRVLERRLLQTTYRVDTVRLAALTFKTWKASREDRQVQGLTWRSTGPRSEPFPYLNEEGERNEKR